jgi:peptide/nickel transport system substrate-binding protein
MSISRLSLTAHSGGRIFTLRRIGHRIALILAAMSLCWLMVPASAEPEPTYAVAFTVREAPSPFATPVHGGPHWVTTTFLFDSLVWKDQNGLVPLLAQSWQSSENKKVWTFKLRQDVRWHDGQPFTADDVKFTVDYLREHPLALAASEATSRIERIEVRSPLEVVFYLQSPWPDFLTDVAGIILIIPRHIWQSVTDPRKFLQPSAFIGTGPFKYIETRRGEYHLLESNAQYFLGRPAVERLVFKAVNNPPLALKSGDVDAASFSSPLAMARFEGGDDFVIENGPYSYYVTKLIFNVAHPPFTSKLVRQAFAYALDRQAIVNTVLSGNGLVSSAGLLHPDSRWFDPELPRYEYHPQRAEELLRQAGFSGKDADGVLESADGSRLSFILYQRGESPDMACVAEMIKDQLAAAGIHLDIKPVNTGVLEGLLSKGDFDIALDGHGGTIRLELVADNPDFSARVYHNDELETLKTTFSTSLEAEVRRAAAWKIQRIIAEDLPALPIYHPGSPVVYRKSKGIRWFWTKEGLGGGAPIWWNKLALLRSGASPGSALSSAPPAGMTRSIVVLAVAVIILSALFIRFGNRSGR